MRGIKIPQQDFALKTQGGGGGSVSAGHYGMCNTNTVCASKYMTDVHEGDCFVVVL